MRKVLGALAAFVVASSAWAGVAGANDNDLVLATTSLDASLALTSDGAEAEMSFQPGWPSKQDQYIRVGELKKPISVDASLALTSDGAEAEMSIQNGWPMKVTGVSCKTCG